MHAKLDPLSATEFLHRHWQKRPRYLPAAIEAGAPQLDSGELAWLALQQDVESRLVFTDRTADTVSYRLEEGPFDEQLLSNLPSRDWTLLVQDVEKHLPEFRQWLNAVPFIPDWRIDDLMVSFAATGGSVGPHLDNYDVFLCQGEGTREWRLGDSAAAVPMQNGSGLSLLRPFAADAMFQSTTGDILYLPPGVPHWGVATESCMTYSIGLRAPESRELQLTIDRLYPETRCRIGDEDLAFYTDPDLQADEASPGEISARAIKRARHCFPFAGKLDRASFVRVFGCTVTDPKAWLSPEGIAVDELDELGDKPGAPPLAVHGMAKLAWCNTDSGSLLFVNGTSIVANRQEAALFRQICNDRELSRAAASELLTGANPGQSREFFESLLEYGAFDAEGLILPA
jgi:50S ribosomal protein L16 3-hydroxylase